MTDQDQPTEQLPAMVFGNTKIHGPGSDAWFWPPIRSAEEEAAGIEEDIFPLVLQIGVWLKRLTVEEARELRRQRGAEFWHNVDRRTCDAETEAIIARCLSRPSPPPAASGND